MRHSEHGLEWELDDDPKKGQLGLLREDHYRLLFSAGNRSTSFAEGDVWLDIGANIGAFALRAAPLVREVIAVEPDPANMEALRVNQELNHIDNVYRLKAAVYAGPHGQWVTLALSNSYSSTHRLGRIRGRKTIEVAGININDTIAMYNVNKIKMDCEGTEAEILEAMDYTNIEEIVFEYHFAMLHDESWERFNNIRELMKANGFIFRKEPAAQSKTWHTIVWAIRP